MRKQIVITGIPKSGTTYLCSILFNFSNTVVLSEPPMLDVMHKELNKGVKDLFNYYYEEVLKHEEVPNLFKKDGTLVTDYRTEKWVKVRGVHEFDNDDFIFGIKNPRTFLNRLPGIIESMPNAKIVVVVRNPYDTVGSFRRFQGGMSFGTGIYKLQTYYKNLLGIDIVKIGNSNEGSVLIWKFWTDLIMKYLNKIILVKYHDLVLEPQEAVNRIFGDWNPGSALEPIEPSKIRYSRECMLDGDKELVEKHCKENAKILGVW